MNMADAKTNCEEKEAKLVVAQNLTEELYIRGKNIKQSHI